MRYVCLNCGERFDNEKAKEDGKVRCPSCMRVTGIEKLKEPAASSAARNPWLVPGIVIALVAAMGGGYAIWRQSAPREVGDEVPSRPLEHDELVGHLRRLRVDARSVIGLLRAGDDIEAFAESATSGRRAAFERADAVQAAIRARASAHAFSRWSLGVPREVPVADAETVWGWIREDGGRKRLYPLEAAGRDDRGAAPSRCLRDARRKHGHSLAIARRRPIGAFRYYVVAVYEGEARGWGAAAL